MRAYGRYEWLTFGTNRQGWNRTRAELESERIMQQIERGTWERFFGRYRLSAITPRVVDRFRDELAHQAHTIRTAAQRGRPVMETATETRGRSYERRRRPLSNTSINMLITLLGQILQEAVDYELIDRNPVRVGGLAARFLKRARPERTFLEVDELHVLLDAAAELEAEAPANRQGLGRRAMIANLGLAGFRIGETMDLKVGQVDLRRGRFKLADAKTEAGVREVEVTLSLRDELLAHAMDRRLRGLPHGPSDHTTSPAPRRASAGTRTASATGSWAEPLRAPARTVPRAAWRRCRRSPRTRCGGPGPRSAR